MRFIIIGLVSGAVAGLLGDIGTVLVVPMLIALNATSSFKEAIGTSLAMLLPPVGIFAAYQYYKDGYMNIWGAWTMVVAFTISSYFSSQYIHEVKTKWLQKIFAVMLVFMGVLLWFSEL